MLKRSLLALALVSSFVYAECIVGSDIHCNSTIDKYIYNDAVFDFPNANTVNVELLGTAVDGISNTNNGTWTFNDVSIYTSSSNASAVNIWQSGININENLSITTNAINSKAITANNNALINLNANTNIITLKNNSDALQAFGNSTINVAGNLYAATAGNHSYGVLADDESNVALRDNTFIATNGSYSYAFYASDNSAISTGENLTIVTQGSFSHAIVVSDSTIITGANANITTKSDEVIAVYADNATVVLGNNTRINTQGNKSYGIYALENSNVLLNGNADITALGNNSYAIVSSGLVAVSYPAKISIQGDIISHNNGFIDLDMMEGSVFIGNTYMLNASSISLSFDNSIWQMNANSSLRDLLITNDSNIYLSHNTSLYTVLNVKSLSGGNSTFNVKVGSQNGSLIGDKILITDSSSGEYHILIDDRSTGGFKNPNQTIILVEQSNGSNLLNYNANFILNANSVDIGQYVYTLNTTNGVNDKNFFLSTEGTLNSAALSSISFLNINYLTNYISTQTLLQRLGDIRSDEDIEKGIWVKGYMGRLNSFDKELNINDVDYYGISGGIDSIYGVSDGDIFVGVFLDFAKLNVNYDKGSGNGKNKAVGLYTIYKTKDGIYFDLVGKYTFMNNKFNTVTSGGREVAGNGNVKGFLISVETGKRLRFGKSFYAEPQLSFIYSNHGDMNIKSSNGLEVQFESIDSVVGRASLLLGYKHQDLNIYLKGGYIKEFDGKTSYAFNDDLQKYKYTLEGSFLDTGVGITINNKNRHFYLEGSYQKGDYFDNQKINIGYRFSF
ncbi:MAG: autotransporter outer membrane beta-barrel domain-containing protein [Campylobacteraceae bacterium]|jgi:outer membrane autotransporter protein|nr:autotransporter outer membrane beta-barrel domain-containing protein [Campylobacteraceae bacterium]